jgi:hypothetical protein
MATKFTLVSITLLLTVTTRALPSAAVDVHALPFPLLGEATDAAADCWQAVVQAESCAPDILRWLTAPDIQVSAACCSVLRTAGDRCIHELFPASTFGQLYAPLVSKACGIPKKETPSGRQ